MIDRRGDGQREVCIKWNKLPLIINNVTDIVDFIFVQTTSNNVQDIIESRVEKRTKGVYVPIGGKKLLTLMDDFNMPAKDTFGSQPPLELIKLWLDYGFWYDRQKQSVKQIKVCCLTSIFFYLTMSYLFWQETSHAIYTTLTCLYFKH